MQGNEATNRKDLIKLGVVSLSPAKDIKGGEGAPLAEITCAAAIRWIGKIWLLCEALRLAPAFCIVPHLCGAVISQLLGSILV